MIKSPSGWLVLLVLVEFVAPSKLAAEAVIHPCPKHCTCDSAKMSMRCMHLRGGIPQPIGQQASFFSFTNHSAALTMLIMHRAIFTHPTLSRDNFSHPIYAELVDLAFTMTNVETIESRTFENLPKLSRLVFKYNQNLKYVEPEAFFGLNLQLLEFHESPELLLQRDTVFVEARANKVVVTKCGLTDFSYDVFHLLLKLSLPMSSLDLEGNSITSVDSRFWPLFLNISHINLDGNSLICVEQNYWLYSLFRSRPERFALPDQSLEKKPDLSCTRKGSSEVVSFRDAKPADFEIKPGGTTLIICSNSKSETEAIYRLLTVRNRSNRVLLSEAGGDGERPAGDGVANLFYEVQVDPQQFIEPNPAGRSIDSVAGTNNKPPTVKPDDQPQREPEYEPDPVDATMPGERISGVAGGAGGVMSVASSAGSATIKRLVLTRPWKYPTTQSPTYESISEITDDSITTTGQQEVGSTNADAFFYILIIAGSISFLSIIIGVITSVRRAATWPRHQKGVIDVDNGKSRSAAINIAGDKSMQLNGANLRNHCHNHQHNNVYGERLLNSSAETTTNSGIGESAAVDSSAGGCAKNRCFNIIENDNSHLYSVIDRSKSVASNTGNIINNNHDNIYADNSSNRYQHHSSNSTSPLLSASPQGSSHSSSTRSAILLGPLPPPVKVIRFADMESDEC